MVKDIMKNLIQKLNDASYAYYALDKSYISDKQYDEMYDKLVDLEQKTGIVLAGSPTHKVQGYILSKFNKVTHTKPMLSAQKTKNINEIKSYLGSYSWYCSGKLDGCTLVLKFNNGEFTQGITRGNGLVGEDVTDACKFIKNIPMRIPWNEYLEVRGECVMSWSEFDRINDNLRDKYSHPRNLASGTLRQLDLNVVKERELSFVAFENVSRHYDTKTEDLKFLDDLGFETVIRRSGDGNDIKVVSEEMTARVKEDKYPYDGLVFAINDYSICDKLGTTAHHPLDIYALKWADSVYETTLLDVEWNVGKTGVVFPTGIVAPVDLDGAITSRVTLNNITYIKELELGLGDTVTIYRSNMVIPCIDDNLTRSNTLEIPTTCPVCGGETKIVGENASEILICTNPDCKGKLLGKLVHFVSRKAMDIDGLSEKTLSVLINRGKLTSFVDIYHHENWAEDLKKIPGFGKRSVDKLVSAIEASRNCKLENFICALSIPGIGSAQAQVLANRFKDWPSFYEAVTNNFNFTRIEGFGNVANNNIRNFLRNNRDISNLVSCLNFVSSTPADDNLVSSNGGNLSISGLTFVITGKLNGGTRDQYVAKISALGGKVASAVSKNTDYLINNDINSTSSKNTKAKSLGIPIITEAQFLEMVE